MNNQVLKTIRTSMCPKDRWVPDKDVTNCFKCDSRFNKLYRWKHHCRICGKIFCSPCCEFYIMGSDLGEEDKPLRTCEFCNQKFWCYVMQKDPEYYVHRKNDEIYMNKAMAAVEPLTKHNIKVAVLPKQGNKTQDDKMNYIKALLTDSQIQGDTMPLNKFWQAAESKLSLILQIVLKMNKIPFDYYDLLQKITKRVITELPANAMVTRNMDICANIKIKYEKQPQVGARYVAGTLIRKTMTSKKMPTVFENINIILMYGNCEAADIVGVRANSFVNFEEMIENRKKETQKIIDKLRTMEVSMVFLEGSIDREAQDILFSRDIVVFSKIEINILSKLKKSLEIVKVVEKVSALDINEKHLCVGRSKLVYSTKIGSFNGSDESALVVEGLKSCNGMTIILAGPNETILRLIKYEFKQIMRIGRHLVLKIYKMLLDQDMMQSMAPEIRVSLSNPAAANLFFSYNVESEGTIINYLRLRYMVYKRIVFVESDFSPTSFPEITKQLAQNYIRKKYRSFKKRWKFFTQICQQFNESRRIYSQDDVPVGEYLLKKLLSINMKCEHCRKPYYQHIQVFYWQHLYIKVEVQSRIVEANQINDPNGFDCQAMFEQLSKIKNKQKIENYIECYDCHAQLTDKFTLRQEHLELSFVAYITHIFHSTHLALLKYPAQESKKEVCTHTHKCRVFQLGSVFLRIYIDFLVLSPEHKISRQQSEQIVKKKQVKALNQLSMQLSLNLQHISNYIESEIHNVAESIKSPNLSFIMKNPKESFLKAMTYYQSMDKEDIVLTKSQYLEVLIPELLQHLNRVNNLNFSLLSFKANKNFLEAWRKFASLSYILSRIHRIINFLHKSKRNNSATRHRLHRQSIDNSIQMEEIDINTQIEEEQTYNATNRIQAQLHDISASTMEEPIISTLSDHSYDKNGEQWTINSPPKRDSNFPSLMSRKLRKTESALCDYEPNISREAIEAILKTTVSSYSTSTYLNQIPCNSTCQSIISNALNSNAHKDALEKNLSEVLIRLTTLQAKFESENEQLKKINNMLDTHEKSLEVPKQKKLSAENYTDVVIYFPKLFQVIRQARGLQIESFITTIVGTDINSSESKTGIYSLQSYNDLICMRFVREKEFQSLCKMLPKYFKHIEEPTLLSRIYGAYEITKNSKTEYVVIIENVFFGMEQWEIYDMKGTRLRRYSKPPYLSMDVNYLLDRNSQPIFSSNDVLLPLKRTAEFLNENGIFDYSLTLIISIEDPSDQYLDGNRIKVCISNYIRQQSTNEKISKTIMGIAGSSAESKNYGQRFYQTLRRYFWSIPE